MPSLRHTQRNIIWIEDGVAAIRDYADGKDNNFQPEAGNSVAWGIIAEAFKYDLDPTDEKHPRIATAYLLEEVSWTGMSEFKAGLTASRTRQLCDVMTVSKDLMADLHLSAGGRAGISVGGGGSNGELTNWDGTNKKTGWGMYGGSVKLLQKYYLLVSLHPNCHVLRPSIFP